MDEATVRDRAQAHADAVKEGDLRRAGEDLNADARSKAAEVMRAVPNPVLSTELVSVEPSGDDLLVCTRYGGSDSEALVEARWTEEQGRVVIGDLKLR